MSPRAEHYLNLVLKTKDKYILIKKKRGLKNEKAIIKERGRVMAEIENSLKLFGIKYDRMGMKIRIRD